MGSSIHHSFDVETAREYGIEEALLIHHFKYWIAQNKRKSRNFKEDRYWMYQTHEEIQDHFPYFPNRFKVMRIIKNLIEKGVIIKGEFNKSGYDRTGWYAFKDEERFLSHIKPVSIESVQKESEDPIERVQKCSLKSEDLHNQKCKVAPPIPDTKTDTKTKHHHPSPSSRSCDSSLDEVVSFSSSSRDPDVIGQEMIRSGLNVEAVEATVVAFKEKIPGTVKSPRKWMEAVYQQKVESGKGNALIDKRKAYVKTMTRRSPDNYGYDGTKPYFDSMSGSRKDPVYFEGSEEFWVSHGLGMNAPPQENFTETLFAIPAGSPF